MPTTNIPEAQNFVLDGEPWSFYSRLLRHFDGRRRLFITYYQGCLEIATRTFWRENVAHMTARLVHAWTEERMIPIHGGGSTRFRRRDLRCGLEPDQCFWTAHEAQVRGLKRINPRRDPPPDLVIDVVAKRPCIPRLPIYAALGVPEVWRIAGGVLSFQVLQPDGAYSAAPVSRALPPLTPNDLQRFLNLRGQVDENAVVRPFRAWVRQLPPPTP